MAFDTPYSLGNKSIYQVFPRIYTKEGTFKAMEKYLPEIRKMGFDYLYLLPVHPRGEANKKGTYGSPYAIKNYYEVDSLLGNMEDFEHLVKACHEARLNVIMDIVFNHTAFDCVYVNNHPEYYIKDDEGNFTRKISEWDDVIDFDFSNVNLRNELINVLEFWQSKGIDGIRCDCSSIIPVSFWKKAREILKKNNPEFIMLAESVHADFIRKNRLKGVTIATDSEEFETFDACYSYDIAVYFEEAVKTDTDLREYADIINYQQAAFPANALKINHLENHDQPRIAELVKDRSMIRNWVAFSFLAKGIAFVYAGEEIYVDTLPVIFEKQDINWETDDLSLVNLITKLNRIKKDVIKNDYVDFQMIPYKDILSFEINTGGKHYLGIFNVHGVNGDYPINLNDGYYTNMIDGSSIEIKDKMISIGKEPVFIEV